MSLKAFSTLVNQVVSSGVAPPGQHLRPYPQGVERQRGAGRRGAEQPGSRSVQTHIPRSRHCSHATHAHHPRIHGLRVGMN
jgi:hypothetical protein